MKKTNPVVTVPSAYVTKGKQRIKQYNNSVYLKNGDEFEIELFNPTTNKVLAKIELNGKSIGSGIILRPGERVFLERYFDVAKKFLFETYKVSGDNEQVKKAIELNGKVEVKFYNEYVDYGRFLTPSVTTSPIFPQPTPWYDPWNTPYYYGNNFFVGSSSSNIGGGGTSSSLSSGTFLYNQSLDGSSSTLSDNKFTYTNSSSEFKTSSFDDSSILRSKKTFLPKKRIRKLSEETDIETGRIEQGSHSQQSFTYDHTKFNDYYSWTSSWTILPESRKQVVAEDLVLHCTKCGTKRKKQSFVFCPKCGTKF